MFLIVHRHRHRKCFASPLTKTSIQKRTENYNPCSSIDNKMVIDCPDVKSDEYQEPYQALKCAPYFSYSTVLLEMKDFVKDSNAALSGLLFGNFRYYILLFRIVIIFLHELYASMLFLCISYINTKVHLNPFSSFCV